MAVETRRDERRQGREARCSSIASATGSSGPSSEMLGPVRGRRTHRRQHRARLLGADDHAGDPRRPRGDARRSRSRRRVGDAIAIRIRDIAVTSIATASGNDLPIGGPLQRRSLLRAGVRRAAARSDRQTRRGRASARTRVRCAQLRRADAARSRSPTATRSRSTTQRRVGVTVGRRGGGGVRARRRPRPPRCPSSSIQNPILAVRAARPRRPGHAAAPVHGPARHDAVDRPCPDSHNAGDFGAFLRRRAHTRSRCTRGARSAPHRRPHGHRRGARRARSSICPVKVAGRRRLPGRHARDAGRRRDRRPHLRRRPAR